MRIQITDPEHPHFEEYGELTGKAIELIFGEKWAYVELENCPHGTQACYVSKGQIAEIKQRREK